MSLSPDLDAMMSLLRSFLEARINASAFVDAFFPIARVLRDRDWEIIKTHPTFGPAFEAFGQRKITSQELEAQRLAFLASLNETDRCIALASEPLSHLWVETDAYREDPEDREPGYHIGEEELKAVVQETLTALEN